MQLMDFAGSTHRIYELCHRPETVIASAAKQSILSLRRDGLLCCARNDGRGNDCFAEPVIERAPARPVGSQGRRGRCITSPCRRGEVASHGLRHWDRCIPGSPPLPQGGGRAALKQPFFCCEPPSPCYKPAAAVTMIWDELYPESLSRSIPMAWSMMATRKTPRGFLPPSPASPP